jgi:hypothetical protein
MACEIPIVTTSLPELQKYSNVVGYSLTREDFSENCIQVINGQFSMKIKNYRALAESNSWGRKAEEIKYRLNSLLKLSQ